MWWVRRRAFGGRGAGLRAPATTWMEADSDRGRLGDRFTWGPRRAPQPPRSAAPRRSRGTPRRTGSRHRQARSAPAERRPAQRPGNEPGRGLRGGRRLSGEDHPFFALASSWGAQRREGALDAEGRGEVAADFGLRHAEWGAGGGGAQGKEGREEPASFAQDAGDGADVFGAA